MKTKLLMFICLVFLTLNINAKVYEITWTLGYHNTLDIELGDTVRWNFVGTHDVQSSGSPSFISSSVQGDGTFYEITFNTVGAYYYFCNVHDASNMDGTINVTDTLGLDDIDQRDNFSIYPNPSIDELNFKLPESNDVINIEVFDVLGKKTHTTSIINSQKIDVKNWKNGVYFINVIYDEKRVTKVFIKN